jgi:predicted TIM-barrel fold metal-dependent hydrolase
LHGRGDTHLNDQGSDHANIMFAIDFPYEDSKHSVKFLMDAPITANQRSKISHENAERFFSIGPLR